MQEYTGKRHQKISRQLYELLMKISRYFHFDSINWDVLPELSTHLARHSITLGKASVTLSRFPDSIEVESLEAAQELVRRGFQPDSYALWVRCKRDSTSVNIRLRKHQLSSSPSQRLFLSASTAEVIVSSVADFLSLQPVEKVFGRVLVVSVLLFPPVPVAPSAVERPVTPYDPVAAALPTRLPPRA